MDQIISSKSLSSDSKTSESNGKLYERYLSSSRHQFFGCIVSNIILIGDTDLKKTAKYLVSDYEPMHSLENFGFLNSHAQN